MQIAYKVVTRNLNKHGFHYRRSVCMSGIYSVQYNKGEILETKDTLGFFCFLDRDKVINYIKDYCVNSSKWNRYVKIIRVELLDNFNTLTRRSSSITQDSISSFYKFPFDKLGTNLIPNGAICCKKIRVLS